MQRCIDADKASRAKIDSFIATFEEKKCALAEALDAIAERHDKLKEGQQLLMSKNEGSNVNESDVLNINAGGKTVTVTRGTLTQMKGTRLEALFSGRWEKQLPCDEAGQIFLDVNPASFRSIVDYLNELNISSVDNPPEPPYVDEDDKTYLDCLISVLGLSRAVHKKYTNHGQGKDDGNEANKNDNLDVKRDEWRTDTFQEFPEDFQKLLKQEQQALIAAENEIEEQERMFEKEKSFVDYFLNYKPTDIIWFNVSGTIMATKRSTIGFFKDSVLAKQFNNPLWSGMRSDNVLPVSKWDCKGVTDWALKLEGVPDDLSVIFQKNEIDGIALLALDREDLKDLGIKRTKSLAIIMKAIRQLKDDGGRKASFIGHSDYCFGKLLDRLRLQAMCQEYAIPLPSPCIREPELKRFKKIVQFYFPGELAACIMGGMIDSSIVSDIQIQQLQNWLEEDDAQGQFELIYRGSRDGWNASSFHEKCDDNGSTITLIKSTDGYVFGGYADVPWSSSGDFAESSKSFIFALTWANGDAPIKMVQIEPNVSEAICQVASYGPTFGEGHDIYVADNPNSNSNSFVSIGATYICPEGQSSDFITGSENFKVQEMEVFAIR
eukprot:CAMPEP_0172490414 /NCGR_PEP_ID=MMETSP1066-20121228/20820_1 /TAXON_ID=671091 /ORGANISM="Coscinodiscus wailesii, Strain CCMP2513" /LENGTH=605 /DNA_ID=CAMNT_0013258867 /DNA_START=47 /DNA_END=1864 /DNA_ORIENTATION=+